MNSDTLAQETHRGRGGPPLRGSLQTETSMGAWPMLVQAAPEAIAYLAASIESMCTDFLSESAVAFTVT